MKNLLTKIATKHFFVETLETRNRDCLDYYEVSVASMQDALEEAYKAGRASVK